MRSIIHPTDFSQSSIDAFAHALRIAAAARGVLHVVHTEGAFESGDESKTWGQFPRAQELLSNWRTTSPSFGASGQMLSDDVKVVLAAVEASNPAQGVGFYIEKQPLDLMVLMTHVRRSVPDLLHQSVAEEIARRASIPTLFLQEGKKGFVDTKSGELSLRRILFPIDGSVPHDKSALWMDDFTSIVAPDATIHPLHVGAEMPFQGNLFAGEIDVRQGPVVETLISVAEEIKADLIAMPTAGPNNLRKYFSGTVTEQVLRRAPCALLALPVG